MPRITISASNYEKVYSAVKRSPNSRNKTIDLVIKRRKIPVKKGDLLHLYWRNTITRRMEKIGILRCKKAVDCEHPIGYQLVTLLTTYDRKYYLNRQVKKAGFKLDLEQTSKTISVPPHLIDEAENSKALKELGAKYNYGVQYTLI